MKEIEKSRAEKQTPVFQRQKWDDEKILGFWDRHKMKKFPEKTYIVSMFFPNGTYKEFVIIADKPTFSFNKKTYIIEPKKAYWDLMQNQYRLIYHADYITPIERDIKQYVDSKEKEIFLAVNPSNVENIIKQEYVKVLASSQNIDTYLKIGMIVSFVNLGLLLIMNISLYFLQKGLQTIAGG